MTGPKTPEEEEEEFETCAKAAEAKPATANKEENNMVSVYLGIKMDRKYEKS